MESQKNKSYNESYNEYFEKLLKALADDKSKAFKYQEDKYKQSVISDDNQFPLYDRLLAENNKYMISIIIPGVNKLRLAIIESGILEISGYMSINPIIYKSKEFKKDEKFLIRYASPIFKNIKVYDIECNYAKGILDLCFNLPVAEEKISDIAEFDFDSHNK